MADNTQNTGSSKKKKIVTAVIAVALAAALLIGGTFSYLTASSDEVENDFNPNGNSVTLTENNGAEEGEDVDYNFEIVPGTSETKDPTVTATYTLDSYVFLLVDDDTQDLVDYEINTAVYDDDGNITSGIWTLLYSEDESPIEGYAIYYKLVTTEDADTDEDSDEDSGEDGSDEVTTYTKTLNVITGDTVSYSSSLTNADMVDENGDLLTGITLSFKALIIQAEPFDDAAEALSGYLGLPGKAETDNDDDDTSDTILKVSVNTTVANEETDDDGNATTTSSTFTLTIPTSTTIVGTATTTGEDGTTSSSTSTPTSLTLSVTVTTADTVAVVPDGDAGDYTYEISLVDQDGNSVSATSGYMNVVIQIKTGITASNLTVTKLGDSDTTLSTTTSESNGDYYSYDSTTGVLTIYTQSLGEYEIYWNDTGLSLSALSGENLSVTTTTQVTSSYTYAAGFKLDDSSYDTSSGYNDWAVDYALTFSSDFANQYILAYMQDGNGDYMLASYGTNGNSAISANTTYLFYQGLCNKTLGSSSSGNDAIALLSTITGSSKQYNADTTKYLIGMLSVTAMGYTTSMPVSDFSVEVEMRLYEVSEGTATENYIVLGTTTLSYSSSSN